MAELTDRTEVALWHAGTTCLFGKLSANSCLQHHLILPFSSSIDKSSVNPRPLLYRRRMQNSVNSGVQGEAVRRDYVCSASQVVTETHSAYYLPLWETGYKAASPHSRKNCAPLRLLSLLTSRRKHRKSLSEMEYILTYGSTMN